LFEEKGRKQGIFCSEVHLTKTFLDLGETGKKRRGGRTVKIKKGRSLLGKETCI